MWTYMNPNQFPLTTCSREVNSLTNSIKFLQEISEMKRTIGPSFYVLLKDHLFPKKDSELRPHRGLKSR
jgi:hypothetical protein